LVVGEGGREEKRALENEKALVPSSRSRGGSGVNSMSVSLDHSIFDVTCCISEIVRVVPRTDLSGCNRVGFVKKLFDHLVGAAAQQVE
jgi:hypothetical protein